MSKIKGGEMICRVADLFVSVPESGGLEKRCRPYLAEDGAAAEIIIKEELYNEAHWPGLKGDDVAYMDSGWQFYVALMRRGGMMLHSSAVVLDGKAYLFSGPSGMGKSTHTRLWQKEFPGAIVINDDKPAIRITGNEAFIYGTPWSGKTELNINIKKPLKAIVFIERGSENTITKTDIANSVLNLSRQLPNPFYDEDIGIKTIRIINRLFEIGVPVYTLKCSISEDAVKAVYEEIIGGEFS